MFVNIKIMHVLIFYIYFEIYLKNYIFSKICLMIFRSKITDQYIVYRQLTVVIYIQ
jgi:hypothetical protein